ncbi:hypothetical protein AO242_03880 [Pseudomonas sp. ICMP 561]|nr:hypothetical protein AO242_03880 [Pseudomonas sp. ICMP 561]
MLARGAGAFLQAYRLANKFAPTGIALSVARDVPSAGRRQLVGERVDAFLQAYRLANKFAPTGQGLGGGTRRTLSR